MALPLILGAGLLAAGAAGTVATLDRWLFPAPVPPPQPSAPRTPEEMINWTPAMREERDQIAWSNWEPFGPPAPAPATTSSGLVLLLALAGFAVYGVVKR